MSFFRPPAAAAFLAAVLLVVGTHSLRAYDTIGNGFGSGTPYLWKSVRL